MSHTVPVASMTRSDIVNDLRLLLDGSNADVDGITASVAPHPAHDPAGALPGETTMLVTFTDTWGNNRTAEITVTARWREDGCWHLRTQPGEFGDECTECGTITKLDVPQVCQCEHVDHETLATGHPYMRARAGRRRAEHVGPICDDCADGHLAPYVLDPVPDTEQQKACPSEPV